MLKKSSLENDRSSLKVNNARKISAVLGVNPITIIFPNGTGIKDKETQKIERLRDKLLQREESFVKNLL